MIQEEFTCFRDGKRLRGLCYHPHERQGVKFPIAIISHGFMANYLTTRHYAKWFAEMGFCAVCFDFNGGCLHGRSDGDTSQMTLFTEVEDLRSVIEYAKMRGDTIPDDITLMGCSQGGFVSAILAAELKSGIHRLALFYPAFCIPDDARAGRMLGMQFAPGNIPETLHFGPKPIGGEYARSLLDKRFEDMISGYEGPTFICWGTKDNIVAEKYIDVSQALYNCCRMTKITGARHGFTNKEDNEALDAMAEFFHLAENPQDAS